MRDATHTTQVFSLFGSGYLHESHGPGAAFPFQEEQKQISLSTIRAWAGFIGAAAVGLTGLAMWATAALTYVVK
jgi:hypothetical protein